MMRRHPPVVAIVGRSGARKTTLLRGLIKHLSARGYCIGVLKHAHHDFQIDHPGRDSSLLREAGAEAVSISSPVKLAFIEPEPKFKLKRGSLPNPDSGAVA